MSTQSAGQEEALTRTQQAPGLPLLACRVWQTHSCHLSHGPAALCHVPELAKMPALLSGLP